MNQIQYPLGESVWVRRDHSGRGALFLLREIRITTLLVLFSFITLFVLFRTTTIVYRNDSFPPWAAVLLYMFFTFTCIYLTRIVFLQACSLAICPIFFYAEQIDPVQLTIYRLGKPQILVPLQESTVSKALKNHYINLTIVSKNRQSEATLGLLTPEEYDRFMQYWNAAQVDTDA